MKKLLKLVLVLGAVGTLTACQTTQMEKVAQTPSGLPDVTFNQSKTVVQNKLVNFVLIMVGMFQTNQTIMFYVKDD